MTQPYSKARELTVQYLYQREVARSLEFSAEALDALIADHEISPREEKPLRQYCEGILGSLETLDKHIGGLSKAWQVSRLPILDRAILRLGLYELLESKTPFKVILNEAIELAKRYGTQQSPGFINGILDAAAREMRRDEVAD